MNTKRPLIPVTTISNIQACLSDIISGIIGQTAPPTVTRSIRNDQSDLNQNGNIGYCVLKNTRLDLALIFTISFASDLNFPSWLKTSQHGFTVVKRQNTLQQNELDLLVRKQRCKPLSMSKLTLKFDQILLVKP